MALTEAGKELLHYARRILGDVEDAMAQIRMIGRGDVAVVRVGVALLSEPLAAPALKAFQEEHEGIVLDRSAMVGERLLAQLRDGHLDAAVVHQVPALATMDGVVWEPFRTGRLAALVGPGNKLASRETVTISELRDQTFLVNPRLLAPGAFDGLKLMCRELGGFDATVLESAAASTLALDTDWRPILDGTVIAMMAEATARAVHPDRVSVVGIKAPPQYILTLAWRSGERTAAVQRMLDYLRSYRDQHGWLSQFRRVLVYDRGVPEIF